MKGFIHRIILVLAASAGLGQAPVTAAVSHVITYPFPADLDICSSRNVTVDRCFFRTKDDCIAIKVPRKECFPAKSAGASPVAVELENGFNVENVVVQRSVIWNAEWGNALEIGFELLTPHVENIVWRDCDIIRVEAGAVFSIFPADGDRQQACFVGVGEPRR